MAKTHGLFGDVRNFITGGGLDAQDEQLAQMLQRYQDASDQNPAGASDLYHQVGTTNLGPSQAADAIQDPMYQVYQNANLSRLEDQINNGGMDAVDRQKQAEIQNEQALRNRQLRQGAVAESNRRGNTGGALAASLLGGASSAANANQQGLGLASMALQNRNAQMGQQAALAGNVGQNQFNQRFATGGAADSVNRWNAENTQNQANRNEQNRSAGVQGGYNNAMGTARNLNGVTNQTYQQQGQRNQADLDEFGNLIDTGAKLVKGGF